MNVTGDSAPAAALPGHALCGGRFLNSKKPSPGLGAW
jgi:hypothetical protein